MKKFIVGPALSAFGIFLWGYLYWGAPHHLPYKLAGSVPNDAAALMALGKIFPASGFYLLPNPLKGDEQMADNARHGLAQIQITLEPQPAFDAKVMVKGWVHSFVVSLLLALMLARLAPAFRCAAARVRFCAMIGLVIALYDYGMAIWWKHPIGWVSAEALYDFGAFVIAGLVLAQFLTPRGNAAAADAR